MKRRTIGVIAEYNPFHWGHYYQLEQMRQLEPESTLIVLMSGNIVQRGEFAIVDKWHRAEAAIHAGADLVLQLPLAASLQAADYFAEVGIGFAHQLAFDHLFFGSESATTDQLYRYVFERKEVEAEIDQRTSDYLEQGLSYTAAYYQAAAAILPDFDANLPNHMLAIRYISEGLKYEPAIEMSAIPRTVEWQGIEIQSGSEIRQDWVQHQKVDQLAMPPQMKAPFNKNQTTNWQDYFPLLKYRLLTHSQTSLKRLFHIREGIENLLLADIRQAEDFSSWIDTLISRRWTRSSIQRVLLSVLLDIEQEEWNQYRQQLANHPTLQILGFSKRGQQWLRQYQGDVTLLSNIRLRESQSWPLAIRVDQVFQANPRKQLDEQIYSRYPIQCKE